MTKVKGAHLQPLYDLLKTGLFTLRGEREELDIRAKQKESGYVPRHKVSAQRFKQAHDNTAGIQHAWSLASSPEFFISTVKNVFHKITM